MELNERLDLAAEAKKNGFNCAQCVVLAFGDLTGFSQETASKVGLALGAGAATGELCGVVSGMGIVLGAVAEGKPEMKASVYKMMREVSGQFRDSHNHLRCSDLKGQNPPHPCPELIAHGITILHEYLQK